MNKQIKQTITHTIKLNNGVEIPRVGLGVRQIPDGVAVETAVLNALKSGYRHIDTAKIYGNEKGVVSAIKKSNIPRKEIFVTTKLWNSDHKDPKKAFEDSLNRLGLDYIDLYLIHWPVSVRLTTWKVFEELYSEGKIKAIGVSNFTIAHLEELLKVSKIIPQVNQVEFSPFLYQKELLEYCKSKGIVLEAYSPLTQGELMNNSIITEIAEKHTKSNAQIMLRWAIEKDVVVLPKSKTKERIEENIKIFDFELDKSDVKKLDALHSNKRFCWNPETMKF